MGAEANPFFRFAADRSSIRCDRAEIASGGTSTRGSSMKTPLESALTWKYFEP